MYGRSILLFAACALPLLAVPIPGHEVISPNQAIERRNDHSVTNILDSIAKRMPSIESWSVEARAVTTMEDKREEALDEAVDADDTNEDEDDLEKRGRLGKGSSNGKRGRLAGGSSNGKRGRLAGGSSNGKRGRIGKGSTNGKRGRIAGGSSNGKRGRIGKSSSNGKRNFIQRTSEIIFG
ncbi:hypothetical protein J4E80_004607 [Alternaria sp. BMP 0032]|nr:hypothetical protein J4E80_004607 [Alternaria sp. BMP 0032]